MNWNWRQLGEAADGGEIVGGYRQDMLELTPRVGDLSELLKRAAKRDAGGKIGRMPFESGAAGGDGLFEAAGAPVFLSESAEGDGRRILPDPAFQIFDARRQKSSEAAATTR